MKKILTAFVTLMMSIACCVLAACAPFTIDMAQSKMEDAGYTVTIHSATEAKLLLMQDVDDLDSALSAVKNGEMFVALYFESMSAAKEYFESSGGVNEYAEQEGKWVYWGTDEAKEDFTKLF